MHALFALLFCGLALGLSGCASLARRAVLPGSYLTAPQCELPRSPDYELLTLQTKEGTQLVAQFGLALDTQGQPLPPDSRRPTVLFFYGNRMCIAASQGIFADLRRMGVNVLIPDYPGYGMSAGVAGEQACYAAAEAAWQYASTRPGLDPTRLVAAGLSIGCGTAVELSTRHPVSGLILVVPLTNVRQTGMDLLPWYGRWAVPLLAHHIAFDNLAKLPTVKAPILMVSATRDHLTSSKRSDELAAAARVELTRVNVEADHDGSWAAGRQAIQGWLQARFPEGFAQAVEIPAKGVSVKP